MNLNQSNSCNNITVGEQIHFFIRFTIFLLYFFSLTDRENLDQTKIFEIGPTFNQNRVVYLFMYNQMIMTPQNEVYIWKFLCQIHIIIPHHMSQSDY